MLQKLKMKSQRMMIKLAGGHKFFLIILICLILIFSKNISAIQIYDYHTENFINKINSEILTVNSYDKKINFKIYKDDFPNAYVTEKNIIYLSSGLLTYSPNYVSLLGVLAHEMGHIENYHIIKRIDSIKNLKSINKIGNVSAIASSILTKNANYLIQTMLANQVNIQNYYSAFSREQEREADIYAIRTLNELKLSPEPLKFFLQILEQKSFRRGMTEEKFKFASHPVYSERFDIIENLSKKQIYTNYDNYETRFNFIKAKLFGFTELDNVNIHRYLNGDYYDYSSSIILSRKGKLKESLIILNQLINKYPKIIFLLETKADLLLSHAYLKEAIEFYSKVWNVNNKNNYVKKRIFEIKYEQSKIEKNIELNNLLNDYIDLLMIFQKDVLLHKKFKKISQTKIDKEWENFIDASLYMINNEYNKALTLLENIVLESNSKKLKKLATKKIRLINNE